MNMMRYHIQLNRFRTTVMLDQIIAELLAIKLNTKPGTKEAHYAVRKQLNLLLPDDPDISGLGLGKYLTRKAVLFISDTILSNKYWQFYFKEH
jgi:hypothetical protein